MALFYERSAVWRAIVHATRDPRVLIGVTAFTVTGGWFLGKGAQLATSNSSEKTEEEIKESFKKDWEAARYAQHSKNALAVMFDSLQKSDASPSDNEKYKKNPIKLPGVMWHPSIQKREKQRQQQLEQKVTSSSTTNAKSVNDDKQKQDKPSTPASTKG